jgi:hypothetical protein
MITSPQAINFSNARIRVMADLLAKAYDAATIILNYWNANGGAGLANPVTLPTVVAAAGGAFAAGTYFWKYTWVNAKGETLASGDSTPGLVVTLNQKVTVTIPALPAGATQANIYRGTVAGSELLVGNTATTIFVDTGTAGTVASPSSNTTGLIPNDSEVINDGSATDGRSQITGAQANNIINRATDIKNFMEGSVAVATNDGSKSVLNTVLGVAVNISSGI